jgi:uncharacterized protein with WD repeat
LQEKEKAAEEHRWSISEYKKYLESCDFIKVESCDFKYLEINDFLILYSLDSILSLIVGEYPLEKSSRSLRR